MTADQVDFIIAEYNALHAEIYALLEVQRTLPWYALLVSSAIWGWLFARKSDVPLPKRVTFVAPVLVSFLALRAGDIALQARYIGKYLSTIESTFALPPGLGWETNLQHSNYPMKIVVIEYALWTLIVILNAIVARYYWKHIPTDKVVS